MAHDYIKALLWFGFGVLTFFVVIMAIVNYPGSPAAIIEDISSSNNITNKEQALYQYCLLETGLKYPIATSTVIERLCELEQIGRLSS